MSVGLSGAVERMPPTGGMISIGFGGMPPSGLGVMPPVGLVRAAPVYLAGAGLMGLGRAVQTGVGATPHLGFDTASSHFLRAAVLPAMSGNGTVVPLALPICFGVSPLHDIDAAVEVPLFKDAPVSETTAPCYASRTLVQGAGAEGLALKRGDEEEFTSNGHTTLLSPDCESLMSAAASFAQSVGRQMSAEISPSDDAMACLVCGKLYHTAEGLRLHHRNHHSADKRWRCFAAGCKARSFVRRTDLRVHVIRMHSAERPYRCGAASCDKQFACRSELRKHVRTKHAEDVAAFTERVPPAESSQEGQNLFSS